MNAADAARQVLDEQEAAKRLFEDADVEEGKYTYLACTHAPALARVTVAVEALVGEMEREAERIQGSVADLDDFSLGLRDAHQECAARLRAILDDAARQTSDTSDLDDD